MKDITNKHIIKTFIGGVSVIKDAHDNDPDMNTPTRTVKVTITTEQEDRDTDVIRTAGIDLTNYKNNPVVLFNHNREYPIARAISIEHNETSIDAVTRFADPGISKKADEVFGLIKNGIINAASIGFKVVDYTDYGDFGYDFLETELLEFSFVPIPANANALIIERRSVLDYTPQPLSCNPNLARLKRDQRIRLLRLAA